MPVNPELRFETGEIPIRANGALTAGYAAKASTPNTAGEQRIAAMAAVGQSATFLNVERFMGIVKSDIADGGLGDLIVSGRTRAIGGAAITAPCFVTWDATGKLVTYTHDATKFGGVAGIAVTDCSGSGAGFDLWLTPFVAMPASATDVDFTLSGILTALTLHITGNSTLDGTLLVSGNLTAGARVLHKQGADVASANNLVLGSDGNAFEITGVTEVQLISNLTWQNGAEVTLLFTSTPTVKHGTATAGTNITLLLEGAADFVAAAGDSLTLVLSEIGGTQAWREKARKGQLSTTAIVATTIAPSGNVTFGARSIHKQGADVASANDLVLGGDGNVFEVTGATQVNHIANTGWQNGAEVTLYFTGIVTVDHANATAGANIIILLDGAVDFVSAAGDMLKLTLCEIGGTQAWRESGRMTVA